ncbi:beta-phosphoglucomutase [Vagococcus humatus]|uniref:Beta-phosphoglucomutase n=1 Tax=Vagococcus humatus TaxID=1889241 RepID=A0A429Z7Z7_9ENTE|nr:beta-phosphoglucomutase [Vagococcus humatus]RST89850.1 beta-phosphoglucomutase [Vagococcus humatus]
MKKGFVFDLDGVIADTAKFHYLAWKELASSIDITLDEVFNEELKGISRMDSLEKILAFGGKDKEYSITEKECLATQKNERYVALLSNVTQQDVLPGVLSFLEQARQANIPCAIASASKNAPYILDKLRVDDYFVHIVNPDTLKKGKPDPEIFIKAAKAIQVLPCEAVGFEDAQAGVDGLKKAGFYTVGIVKNQPLVGADLLVRQLDEINFSKLIN